METADPLALGREAFARNVWGEAFSQLGLADDSAELGLDDVERLALAAFLTARDYAATDAWTRAHQYAIRLDDLPRAARNAFMIGSGLMFRGEVAPAMGWFARGGRVLEGQPECAEHAWHGVLTAYPPMFGGDPEGAEPAFTHGVEAARRFGDTDLSTMSRLGQGMCAVLSGHVQPGLALLDEVMVGVTSGEVSPIFSGMAYCTVIMACSQVFDLRRAREWTAALTRWCDAQPDLVPYRGNCLVHRCELLQLEGDWNGALDAAERACDLLSGPIKWDSLGSAHYQLGELRRLRGEFADAEESFVRARDAGREPQPGVALLRLAQGRDDAAASIIRRVVDEVLDPPSRSRVLPAFVEIMLAVGDIASARMGADELAHIAGLLDAPYLHAVASQAGGAVCLAEEDPRAALQHLRNSAVTWRELQAPHESACTRMLIGLACQSLGDFETSAAEFAGARAVFEELGATSDVERLDAIAGGARLPRPGGLSAREVEVLRHVASGMTNRAIAKELVLSERTVAHHVSNIFTKLGVPSRAAATAYAYERGLIQAP